MIWYSDSYFQQENNEKRKIFDIKKNSISVHHHITPDVALQIIIVVNLQRNRYSEYYGIFVFYDDLSGRF